MMVRRISRGSGGNCNSSRFSQVSQEAPQHNISEALLAHAVAARTIEIILLRFLDGGAVAIELVHNNIVEVFAIINNVTCRTQRNFHIAT